VQNVGAGRPGPAPARRADPFVLGDVEGPESEAGAGRRDHERHKAEVGGLGGGFGGVNTALLLDRALRRRRALDVTR